MAALFFTRLTSADWIALVTLLVIIICAVVILFLSSHLYWALSDYRAREARKADSLAQLHAEIKKIISRNTHF